ncbi:MAG: hypothetical protein R6V52_03930, partial [Bacteroidales bacterium]
STVTAFVNPSFWINMAREPWQLAGQRWRECRLFSKNQENTPVLLFLDFSKSLQSARKDRACLQSTLCSAG